MNKLLSTMNAHTDYKTQENQEDRKTSVTKFTYEIYDFREPNYSKHVTRLLEMFKQTFCSRDLRYFYCDLSSRGRSLPPLQGGI